jgi:hypothetical protein
MPIELLILLAGLVLCGLFFLFLIAGGVLLYRRRAEQRVEAMRAQAEERYGEPPEWMVQAWKRKAAAKARRREADARLVDLVEEHHEPGEVV